MHQTPSSVRASQSDTAPQLGGVQCIGFIDRIYTGALALLVEARNYFAYQEPGDVKGLSDSARLLVSQETMRITCRLTQCMAWLFAQKAVQNGERPPEWALGEEHRLGGHSVCLEERWHDNPNLPAKIHDLQARSLALFQRIDRLDRQLRNPAAPGGPGAGGAVLVNWGALRSS